MHRWNEPPWGDVESICHSPLVIHDLPALLMTFLPIVERELRTAARRRGTYWIRLGVAALGLFIGGWILLVPEMRRPGVIGSVLFYAMSITGFIYGLLVGVITTADCLSEEKREGTLGLLFLTDLKGYDIVLGKLAATSINGVYGLMALVPIMAIPLLAGGVTGAEFWRVVMVSMNNMFFSLAVGMFCSAMCRDERKAMVLTFSIILLFSVVLPFLGLILYGNRSPYIFYPVFFVPSPAYGCFFAFDASWRSGPGFNFFYWSLLCVQSMGWILLGIACLVVPRTWQDRAATPAQQRRQVWVQQLIFGAPHARARFRKRLLEANPFYWLAARERLKPAAVWLVFAVMGGFWTWGLIFHPQDWKNEVAYVLTALVLHSVLKLGLALEACRRFAADRKSGALELLLSTPLTVNEILRGQRLALARQFAWPTFALLIIDLIFLMARRHSADWVMMCVAGMVTLAADLLALTWVGMWRSLNSQHANRAFAGTVIRILILPWVLFGLAETFVALLWSALKINRWDDTEQKLLWLFISVAIDLGFGFSARQRLHKQFRTIATERFERKRLGWRRRK